MLSHEIILKLKGFPDFTIVDFKKRVLYGGTSSRFQEAYMYGTTLWYIPVDQATNGYASSQGHFPIKM